MGGPVGGPVGAVPADRLRPVVERVRARLAVGDVRPETVGAAVRRAAAESGLLLSRTDTEVVVGRVRAELWGLGPLQALVEAAGVTDVLVNGPGEVWVDAGSGLRRVPSPLADEAQVRALAVRLAAGAGRRLDEAVPHVDARLPGGVRLHAVLPPVSPAGTLLSLRVMARTPFSLEQLAAGGGLPRAWLPVLARIVRHRVAYLVSGGTGAGKTTFLAALLGLVPPDERIVLVEDVGELQPEHPHVVRLEARHENVEGRGAVTLDDLVRQALRMRPDRLVVGECRGPEVRDLLVALNTGHSGGCGTVHANAAADVPARLEALGALAGLGPEAVRAQVGAGLEVVLHVRRRDGRRELVEVAVLRAGSDGRVVVEPALTAGAAPGPGWSRLAGRIAWEGPPP
ncbi:TadA family conjugal transfer-associated ATPase [Spongisporangium articulatum]|uniref:TadA family conjugal transfer-associated ATPase n=1 Tax=Spongisporangium articulatum TaxID=3362603 RepID=A0ABW8AIX8_9ACTN